MLDAPDKLRICNICGKTNRETMFYNFVTSRCAECHKSCVRANRATKRDYYRAYDAKRFQTNPERRKANDRYAKTERGKQVSSISKKKWAALNKAKRDAHVRVGNAVAAGTLKKPDACSVCGCTGRRIHGHHTDYSKPLDVIWVCPPCHAGLHK